MNDDMPVSVARSERCWKNGGRYSSWFHFLAFRVALVLNDGCCALVG
jgi:hypothetical protein